MTSTPRAPRWRAALVAAVLLGVPAACGGGGGDDGPAVRAADEGIEGVLAIRIASEDHTEGEVDYDRSPPAGGDHNPAPAPCGVYPEPIPDEFVVHSLEHGAVWLAVDPELPAAARGTVEALVRRTPDTIATPYPGLADGVAVVVTSWGRQLTLDSVDDPRLERFVEQYRRSDLAPEANVGCPAARGG